MKKASLLSKLERQFPPEQNARVLRALRLNNLTWTALQQTRLAEKALTVLGKNSSWWTPLGIALVAGGYLRDEPAGSLGEVVDAEIKRRAIEFQGSASYRNEKPQTLNDSFLLAVAWRELRRTQGNWEFLATEWKRISSGSSGKDLWPLTSAVTILWPLLSDAKEFVAWLFATFPLGEAARITGTCLVTNAVGDADLQREAAAVLQHEDATRQLAVLIFLRHVGQKDLAASLASRFLTSNPRFAPLRMKTNLDDLSAAQLADRAVALQQMALFNQLAGNTVHADLGLAFADSALRHLMNGIAVQRLEIDSELCPAKIDQGQLSGLLEVLPADAHLRRELAPAILSGGLPASSAGQASTGSDPLQELRTAWEQFQAGDREASRKTAEGAIAEMTGADWFSHPQAPSFSLGWKPADIVRYLLRMEMGDLAEKLCEDLEGAYAADPDSMDLLSQLYASLGKFQKARAYAGYAVALSPQSPRLQTWLKEMDQRSGSWDEAYQHWNSLLVHLDGVSDMETKLAFIESAFKSGRIDEAEDACTTILTNDPEQADAHGWLGVILGKQGRTEEALFHLQKAAGGNPDRAEWWVELVSLHSAAGDRKTAYEVLREAVVAAPENGVIHAVLGRMLAEDGSLTESMPCLRTAVELLPEDLDLRALLISVYRQMGRQEEAREEALSVRRKWAQAPQIAYNFALISEGELERDLTETAYQIAAQAESPQAEWLVSYARYLQNQEEGTEQDPSDTALQMELLGRALELEPENPDARLMRAKLFLDGERYAEALTAYQGLADGRSDLPLEEVWAVQHGMGKAALATGATEVALAALRASSEREPENNQLRRELAEAYLQADLHEEAGQVAEDVLEMNSEQPETLVWFADVMERVGDTAKAEEALLAALQFSDEAPAVLLQLARMQARENGQDFARINLEKVIQSPAASARNLADAADVLEKISESELASQALEKATKLDAAGDPAFTVELARRIGKSGGSQKALNFLAETHPEVLNSREGLATQVELLMTAGKHLQARQALAAFNKLPKQGRQAEDSFLGLQAQVYLHSGDFNTAYDLVMRALENTPADKAVQAQAAELAFARKEFSTLQRISESGSAEGVLDVHSVGIHLYLADLALELGQVATATSAWEQVVGSAHHQAWQLAVESRLDQRSGDWQAGAGKLLRMFSEEGGEQDEKDKEGLIRAGLDFGLWGQVEGLLQASLTQYPNDPKIVFLGFAEILLQAEWQRDSSLLDCPAHSLDMDVLSEERYQAGMRYLHQLKAVLSEGELGRWMARYELAFHPETNTSEPDLLQIQEQAGQVPLVRAARVRGDLDKALELAGQNRDQLPYAMQLALGYLGRNDAEGFALLDAINLPSTSDPRMLYLCSRLAELAGQEEKAANALEDALAIWPDEAAWQARAARNSEKLSDLQGALEHWTAASRLDPHNTVYTRQKALIEYKAGNYEKAEALLNELSTANPADYDMLTDLAQASRAAGNYDAALAAADKAARLRPDEVRNFLLMSSILAEKGERKLSMDFARLALQQSPNHPEAVLALVQALRLAGNSAQALKEIETRSGNLKLTHELEFEQALLNYNLRGAQAALPYFEKVVDDHPEDIEAVSWLAKAQMAVGDGRGAERSALKALRMNPNQVDLNIMVGRLEREIGQLDQSVHYLEQAIKLDPRNPAAYLELGKTHQERREVDQALDSYEKARQLDAQDPRGFVEAANVFKEIKEYRRAEEMLNAAANLAPNDMHIRRQLVAVMALTLLQKTQEEQFRA